MAGNIGKLFYTFLCKAFLLPYFGYPQVVMAFIEWARGVIRDNRQKETRIIRKWIELCKGIHEREIASNRESEMSR